MLAPIGLNTVQSYEVNQLFQYFLISNENLMSKICFA